MLFGHVQKVFYPHFPLLGLLGHGGFIGVELFYVLSGFLIGDILLGLGPRLRSGATLGWFYVRRWLRTLPLFWLFVAVNVWLLWHLQHRIAGSAEIASHALFLRTVVANHISFFPESFSLATEEWFYLLFAAALYAGLKLRLGFGPTFLGAATAFYLFSTIGRCLSADHVGAPWFDWQRVIVIFRFDAIMTGVLAAWVAQRFPEFWKRNATRLAILGAIVVVAVYASLWRVRNGEFVSAPDDFFARTFRFNLLTLGFALLLPFASQWTVEVETPLTTAIRKTALWSYSIYLVQGPIIRLVDAHCFPGWRTSIVQASATFALQVVLTFVISAVLYHWYESPITRLREKFRPAAAKLKAVIAFP